MTKDTFERALEQIEQSFNFNNMVDHDHVLRELCKMGATRRKVVLVYHAFHSSCSSTLMENPLTIGGYVRAAVQNYEESPYALSALVTDVRKSWGPR